MFLVTLEVSPKPSHARYGELDGAYASCWVNEPTAALAELVAREGVAVLHWDVTELDELRVVVREEYLDHPDGLALYDQASIDGLVVRLHTWPVGGDREE